MNVYLLLSAKENHKNKVVRMFEDAGVKVSYSGSVKKAADEMEKAHEKPGVIIVSDAAFVVDGDISYKEAGKQLKFIRKTCPEAEINFLSSTEPPAQLKKLMKSDKIRHCPSKDFDYQAYINKLGGSRKNTGTGMSKRTKGREVKPEKSNGEVPARVLQADSYSKFTEPLMSMKGVNLVGIASTREEVCRKVDELNPDIVTLSPDLPGDGDILEIVDFVSRRARVIFFNPSKLSKIDRETLNEYNIELLDEMTIGALEFQICRRRSVVDTSKEHKAEWTLRGSVLIRSNKMSNVVGVAAVKSTGKTLVAVNLAVKLAEAGNQTILVDLTEDQDVNLWLKASEEKGNLRKVFKGSDNIVDIAWVSEGLGMDNLMVFTEDPALYTPNYERKELVSVLKKLAGAADYVVVDLPNGFYSTQADVIIKDAGKILIVADTDLARNEKLITEIGKFPKRSIKPGRFALLLNNASDCGDDEKAYLEEKTNLKIRFAIPSKPEEVRRSIVRGEPLCLYESEFSNIFTEIAEFIEGELNGQTHIGEE